MKKYLWFIFFIGEIILYSGELITTQQIDWLGFLFSIVGIIGYEGENIKEAIDKLKEEKHL